MEELDYRCMDAFIVIPGKDRYQAIVETGHQTREPDILLGDAFSRELDEAVYAIEGRDEDPYVLRFMKGVEARVDQEPEELVRSLGCTLPWFDQPPPKATRLAKAVTLMQGVALEKIQRALEKEVRHPLPTGYYRIEETPLGILITDGTAPWIFSDGYLARYFPRATVYTVIASPDLDFFSVSVTHRRKMVEFVPPGEEPSNHPAIREVMGEREPERILAAMGIPKEWFQL
jgi:hypothetical protein